MNEDITIDFRDLLRFFLRGLVPALVVAVLAAAGTFWWLANRDVVYSTRATILATQPTSELRAFGVSLVAAPPLDASAYSIAATSQPVMNQALQMLGTASPTQEDRARLRGKYQIRTEDTRVSSLIHVDTSVDTTAVDATQTADAIALALVEWDRNRARNNLQRIIDTLEQQIAALDEQIRALQTQPGAQQEQIDSRLLLRAEQQQQLYNARALSTAVIGNLEIVQPAQSPSGRLPLSPIVGGALAFLLGVSLVYGVLLLRAMLDTRLRSVDGISKATGLPVLAEFTRQRGRDRRLPLEAASFLRTNLLFEMRNADSKIILVTSPKPADGKTSVAISLAESFARNGKRTLLVDADMRSPAVSGEYGLPGTLPGLTEYLTDLDLDFRPAVVSVASNHKLAVIPSTSKGAASATDLLSHAIRERLDQWRSMFDVIVVDTPPVLAVADALVIAPHCTGALLIANLQQARRPQLQNAINLLERTGVPILGIAANKVPEEDTSQAYGYGYGYAQSR